MSEFIFIPLFLLATLMLLLLIYNNILTVKRYRISTDKMRGKLRIVLLSDFHNKSYGKGSIRLLNRIIKCDPDVIFITGDTVDRRRPDFKRSADFVKSVCAVADTFLVTGNHERELGVPDTVEKLGCEDILIDEEYKIYRDFSVLGLSDTVGEDDSRQRDLLSVFHKLDNFKIVAVHRPCQFESYLDISSYEIDLVLCGHTHGGAVRMPFFGAIYSPDEGFFPKYSKGIFTKNGTAMVVSGGLGNTFLPLRLNNFPEIVVIDIAEESRTGNGFNG